MKAKSRPKKRPVRRAKPNPTGKLTAAQGLLEDLQQSQPLEDPTLDQKRRDLADLKEKVEDLTLEDSLQMLRGVAASLSGEYDFHGLVKQILAAAVSAMHADRGILFFGRGLDVPLVPVLALNIDGEEMESLERVSRNILREARTAEYYWTPDAQADPVLGRIPSVQLKKVRSVICASLRTLREPIGILYLDSLGTANAFPRESARFLTAFAAIAAVALDGARMRADLRLANTRLTSQLAAQDRFWDLPGVSPAMDALKRQIEVAAQVDALVLLRGETGTEVDRVARMLHSVGPRSLRTFLEYDCSAAPRSLVEDQLFGHARGVNAAPGWERRGIMRDADRGVLFLNEVTALDIGAQEKLVRVIDERAVRPVRSRQVFPIDVRFVTATSRDPRAEVRAGRFSKELLYRLNAIEIVVPSLRERPEDVPVLVEHLVRKYSEELGESSRISFTPEAMEHLERQSWPGNTAQLEWLVRRVLTRNKVGPIDTELVRTLLAAWGETDRGPSDGARGLARAGVDPTRAIRSLAEVDREIIREALIRTGGNRSKTARLLGIRRNTLLRRIDSLGVSLVGIPNRRGRK